ncbi:MAG: LapA family protein [Desulfobacterales bacterium]
MPRFSVILSFLIILFLVIAGFQNIEEVSIQFLWWNTQMALTGALFLSAVAGAAAAAFLSLPKLFRKHRESKRLRSDVDRLEKLCESNKARAQEHPTTEPSQKREIRTGQTS